MAAEWQARQLLLIASDPGPGNIFPLSGRSTVTDFNAIGGCVRADVGTSTAPISSASGSILRDIGPSSSGRDNRGRFYDVAHEPGRIPIGLGGLRHAIAVGAANHERMVALCR